MKYIFIFITTITIIIFIFCIYLLLLEDNIQKYEIYDLQNDGCCVIKNILTKDEIQLLQTKSINKEYLSVKNYLLYYNKTINNYITTILSPDYIFQDYIWIIQKSNVHTCHRDNNGDFFNKGQKHPSYTMLIYLEDMEKCLGIIPKSHKNINANNININNTVVNLLCNKGDAIIFNANLIHVGAINDKDDNLRIQLKITHKDDIKVLNYYQNYNKVLNIDNIIPKPIRKIQNKLSCMFPIISNYSQNENINSSRGTVEGANISIFQTIFSFFFYGNSNFYDLPNILK